MRLRYVKCSYQFLFVTNINTNSQLAATITDFIDNYNQLNMFRAIISSILRSTRLYLQLVLLRMDEIIARNMLG